MHVKWANMCKQKKLYRVLAEESDNEMEDAQVDDGHGDAGAAWQTAQPSAQDLACKSYLILCHASAIARMRIL